MRLYSPFTSNWDTLSISLNDQFPSFCAVCTSNSGKSLASSTVEILWISSPKFPSSISIKLEYLTALTILDEAIAPIIPMRAIIRTISAIIPVL